MSAVAATTTAVVEKAGEGHGRAGRSYDGEGGKSETSGTTSVTNPGCFTRVKSTRRKRGSIDPRARRKFITYIYLPVFISASRLPACLLACLSIR